MAESRNMQGGRDRRLSPRALFNMLDASHAESAATLTQASLLAESRPQRSHERRLIGVAMNMVPWLVSLGSRQWRHHAFDNILAGIRAHADARSIDLILLTGLSSEVTGEATHYADICRVHGAAGIILVAFVPEEPELAELASSDLPCVSIDTSLIGARTSFVVSDSVGGAAAAVHHLAELGRKRIAYMGGWGHEPVSLERRLGYESALEEFGLDLRDEYLLTGGWLHGQARIETHKALELPEPPDAIFCASDRMAIGAMLACEEAGLRIPEDIAIVGFDDESFASLPSPSLTSVRRDQNGLGTAAVEAIVRMLDQPDQAPESIRLPVELVIRESTDPIRAIETASAGSNRPGDLPFERERLMIEEVFRSLGTDELFYPTTYRDTVGAHQERWKPGERKAIAVATDTTPEQSYRHAFFDEVFYRLRASAHEHSADLIILTHVWPGTSSSTPFLDLCRRYRADGIIVSSLPSGDPEMNKLVESGFPCASFDVELLGARTAFVSFDNIGAGIEVVRHLAETGRERIAFIGGRGEERPSVDRLFGYKSELARLGLPYVEEYVHKAQWLHDRAYRGTTEMLALPEPPDAVFCASDIMAVGAMTAIEDAGLRIPEDVAVVGFDDLDVAHLLAPSLTSVRQNQETLVTALMEAVHGLLEHPEAPPKAIVLPVELMVRESSALVRVAGERPTPAV
jgi:LacI family transcriptional regulator